MAQDCHSGQTRTASVVGFVTGVASVCHRRAGQSHAQQQRRASVRLNRTPAQARVRINRSAPLGPASSKYRACSGGSGPLDKIQTGPRRLWLPGSKQIASSFSRLGRVTVPPDPVPTVQSPPQPVPDRALLPIADPCPATSRLHRCHCWSREPSRRGRKGRPHLGLGRSGGLVEPGRTVVSSKARVGAIVGPKSAPDVAAMRFQGSLRVTSTHDSSAPEVSAARSRRQDQRSRPSSGG